VLYSKKTTPKKLTAHVYSDKPVPIVGIIGHPSLDSFRCKRNGNGVILVWRQNKVGLRNVPL
jgi:hypothetical protein